MKSQIETYALKNYAKAKVNSEYLFILFLIIYTSYFNIFLQQTKELDSFLLKQKKSEFYITHHPHPQQKL